LLLLDLGQLQLSLGDEDAALASVQSALEQKSEGTYLGLGNLEEVGRALGRHDVVAQALEARATLITRSIEDNGAGDSLGVPLAIRTPAHAAEALLRASDAHRGRGDLGAAGAALARATELLPTEPAFSRARIALAQAKGNTEAAAKLAEGALAQGSKGAMAAALWLRVAEWAAAQGDGPGALDAVNHALAEDAGSIPARALALDLLGGGHDPQALASAFESTAEQATTDEGKARFFLAAADAWARRAGETAGAKAALSQAGMYGAETGTVARVSRMLSSVTGDAAWFEDSTRRLLAAGATDSEQPSLWFELARSRLGRKEMAGAAKALSSLADSVGGSWLGNVLSAFAMPLLEEVPAEVGDKALEELAKLETDPFAARALSMLRAF
jgi:tetratricopeptide (TPR) repeat protein